MRSLPRLEGKELKTSNEAILKDFGRLAQFVANKRAREFRLSPQQEQDLYQTLLSRIFDSPASYRNYQGLSVILKNESFRAVRAIIKTEAELAVTGLDELHAPEREDYDVDIYFVLKHLDCLSSAERAVFGMTFGVNGCQPFCQEMIARKLGKSQSWVSFTLQKAVMHMQRELGLRETLAGFLNSNGRKK